MKKNSILLITISLLALSGCNDISKPSTSDGIITTTDSTNTTSTTNTSGSQTSISDSTSTTNTSTSGSSSTTLDNESPERLDFYCVNDYHGRINKSISYTSNGSTVYEGGISRLSTYLKDKKKDNEEGSVFLNAGDLWQDTYDSGSNKGELLTKAMKQIGFEAIALGNHEFDWGTSVIESNKAIAESGDEKFTFLGCNIYNYDNNLKEATTQASHIASPYKVINRGNVKIGLIGAIGQGQITSITSRNWENLTFLNPAPIVKDLSDKLRKDEGCDLIIYMLHAAYKDSSASELSSISPVTNKPYVDAGFLGHSHSFESYNVNNVPWIQSYHHGSFVGKISFTKQDDSYKCTYYSSYSTKEDNGYGSGPSSIYACSEDNSINSLINEYLTPSFISKKNEIVGSFINVTEDLNNFGSNIGKVQAYTTSKYIDELRKSNPNIPEIDLVFNNGNRASVALNSDGSISRENVFNLIPFTNNTIIAKVKGSDILYEKNYIKNSYYIPSEESLTIDSNKEYIIAGIDYMVLHKNTSRQYNYFKTYTSSIYEVERYPFDILADYLLENKTFDMSILSNVGFAGLN